MEVLCCIDSVWYSKEWERMRLVRRGSISSDLLMYGGGVRNVLYMEHVCFYVCCCDCEGVCGNVCCVAGIVEDSLV